MDALSHEKKCSEWICWFWLDLDAVGRDGVQNTGMLFNGVFIRKLGAAFSPEIRPKKYYPKLLPYIILVPSVHLLNFRILALRETFYILNRVGYLYMCLLA